MSRYLYSRTQFTLWSLSLFLGSMFLTCQVSAKERSKKKKPKIETKVELSTKKISDKVIWVGLGGGSIASNGENRLIETDKRGTVYYLKASGSVYTKSAIFDLGIGWWNTELKPKKSPNDFQDSSAEGVLANKIKTRLGEAYASVLFGSSLVGLGPTASLFYGVDSGFGPVEERSKNPNVLAGIKLRLGFKKPTAKHRFGSHLEVTYLTDLTIEERKVDFLSIGLNFGFGLVENSKVTERVTRTKYRTKVKKVIVDKTKIKKKVYFFIDAGFINFETAKHNISISQKSYLSSLSQLLETNANAWEKIIVRGHTDRRGSEEFNKPLSNRRANQVAHYLMAKGVWAPSILVQSKVSTEPVSIGPDPKSYAKNRRVEILIRGGRNMDGLKRKIITLQQLHRQPSTCVNSQCR